MTISSELSLGCSANLLHGYRPPWIGGDASAGPLYIARRTPLTTYEVNLSPEAVEPWALPCLTLHDDLTSLISGLFDYVVAPSRDERGEVCVGAGPLMLESGARPRELGEYLGIGLDPQLSYMAVRLRRCVGRAAYADVAVAAAKRFNMLTHLTLEGFRAAIRLRPLLRRVRSKRSLIPDADAAARYLDFFYEYGTHYVSGVTAGDCIFQVFAYEPRHYAALKAAFLRDAAEGAVCGPAAIGYVHYTTPARAAACGRIISLGADPMLDATVREGAWFDGKYAQRDSIFARFAQHAAPLQGFLRRFTAVVPIGLELSPLGDFMDGQRAESFATILAGAMLHKYGNAIQLPVPPIDESGGAVDACANRLKARASLESIEERVELRDLAAAAGGEAFSVCAETLCIDSRPIAIPGNSVSLAGRVIEAPSNTRNAPVLHLTDSAYTSVTIAAARMRGAIVLANQSGTAHATLVNGLRFTTEPSNSPSGYTQVGVAGGLIGAWDRAPQSVESALTQAVARVVAMRRLAPEAIVPSWPRTMAYVDWLAGMIRPDTAGSGLRALAMHAIYRTRIAPNIAMVAAPALSPGLTTCREHFKAIAEAAAELGAMTLRYQARSRVPAGAASSLSREVTPASAADVASYLESLRLGETLVRCVGELQAVARREHAGAVAGARLVLDSALNQLNAAPDALPCACARRALAAVTRAFIGNADAAAAIEVRAVASDSSPPLPLAVWSAIANKIDRLRKTLDVLDGLADPDPEAALERVEAELYQLHSDDLPALHEWPELAANLIATLAPADEPARTRSASAIEALIDAGRALLSARAGSCEALMDDYWNQLLAKLSARCAPLHEGRGQAVGHSGGIEAGIAHPADIQVLTRQWQITALLAQAAGLLGAILETRGPGNPIASECEPVADLNLPALARLVRWRCTRIYGPEH